MIIRRRMRGPLSRLPFWKALFRDAKSSARRIVADWFVWFETDI